MNRIIQLTSHNYYEVLPEKRRLHQLDPLAWYVDRWAGNPNDFKWSLRPEYNGHSWDGTRDPLWAAWDGLACGLWVAMESGTSLGKTYAASIFSYWWLDVWPDSTVVLIGPAFTHLKHTLGAEIKNKFHKFKLLRPNATYFDSLQVIVDNQDLEKSKWKLYGKAIDIAAGEKLNTSAAGAHAEHMLHILDEGAGIPHSVYSSVEHTSTGPNNLVLSMGNPNSQVDALHEFSQKPGVRHVIVSALDHPNIVCNQTVIPGAVSIESVLRRAGINGENRDSPEFKSRVRGLAPKEAHNSLFKKFWFDEAEQRGHDTDFEWDPYSENALGVDVANSMKGDKAACIYSEQNMVTEIVEFQCPDATHLAYNIIHGPEWCGDMGFNRYPVRTLTEAGVWDVQVAVDGNGVGSGTVSTLANMGYRVFNVIGGSIKDCIPSDAEGKPLHSFENLRAQVIWTLAEDMRNGDLAFSPSIPRDMIRQLRNECLVLERVERSSGTIRIMSKEEIKKRLGGKSPNLLDAFAYMNWVRKDRRAQNAGGVSA